MRFRPILLTLALVFCFIAIPSAAHASIPFFGPIIPQTGSGLPGDPAATCPLGWPALIVVINNIISFLITIAITAVAPIMIAYAGFLFVVNPVNASGKQEAKTILWHTVIGIIVALSAYLIVGAIMAVLYKPSAFWTTWSDIVTKGNGDLCIDLAGSLNQVGPPGVGQDPGAGPPDAFDYEPDAAAQKSDASGPLNTLLTCMAGKVPGNVGRVSSISDHVITNGTHTFAQCAAQGHLICSHTTNSCHYGGSGNCNGKSYAADFGDDEHIGVLTTAAHDCGASTLNEGNHLHVSIGSQSGCGCDTGL